MTKTEELKKLAQVKGLRYVGTRGNTSAPVCVVGEAPGADEEACGFPFVGQSGQLQDRMIDEAGLSTSDVWFVNPYKVRPPNNDIDRFDETGIPRSLCVQQFFEELRASRPTFILAAGGTPLSILCPHTVNKKTGDSPIGIWRGSLLTSPELDWPHYVIPSYHPAFVLRDYSEKQLSVFCLQRIVEELDFYKQNNRIRPLPERQLLAQPSYDEAVAFLMKCLEADRVSIDIEMYKRRFPYLIGLADSAQRAISICLHDYPRERAVYIWRIIDQIFRTKALIGQNFTNFDAYWLDWLGFDAGSRVAHVDDTRIRHTILWPPLSHKLEFMTMQYTREPYYKDEGKAYFGKGGSALEYRRYNCKDAAVTYEVYERQEDEFVEEPRKKAFYLRFGKELAARFYHISHRGFKTNRAKLNELDEFIKAELATSCKTFETYVPQGTVVVYDADQARIVEKTGVKAFNVGSQPQLKDLFKGLGLKVYKKRKGGETIDEEHLQLMFAETGHPAVEATLAIRELNKIRSACIKAKYPNDVMYSDYVVGGTIFGRRSSRQIVLGFGVNGQNLPKHSKLAKKVRECVEARPGKILVACDQIGAEDWIIQGIIADQKKDESCLDELRRGIDRHQKLASFLFSVPLDQCTKDCGTIYRHVAKRTRYGMSYDMQGEKLSLVLAKEGFHVPKEHTTYMLAKAHQYEPDIRGVFHEYIKRELTDKKKLVNLFGRETVFFGLHPYRDNSAIFREGYSCIPQGTVGDNTGNAVLYCENRAGWVVADTHDAITLEVEDSFDSLCTALRLLAEAFDTTLRFPNGLELKIPIEFEFGYTLRETKSCVNLEETSLRDLYDSLKTRKTVTNTQVVA